MRRCLERRQVLNLGVSSRESIVDPRRQFVPEGSSRRERGASRPCNGPSGRGMVLVGARAGCAVGMVLVGARARCAVGMVLVEAKKAR